MWEQKLADEKGEKYSYDYEINMTMDNNLLLGDWRYGTEVTALWVLLGIICGVCIVMFAVYKYAMKKAEKIAGINKDGL